MTERIDPVRLNAYIDGELSHEEAADVMTAAAADPAIARELSALMRAKAALPGTVDAPPLALRPPPVWPRLARFAAAAAVVVAIAGAALYSSGLPGSTRGIDAPWAVAAHRNWTAAPPASSIRPAAAGSFVAFGPGTAFVPDLTAARLAVTHIGEISLASGRDALVVGYRGTRGCTLTVAISDAGEVADNAIRAVAAAGFHGKAWRAGSHMYYVVAEGMARSRFDGLVQGIREASLHHAPVSPETRTALARSRANSPPCRA